MNNPNIISGDCLTPLSLTTTPKPNPDPGAAARLALGIGRKLSSLVAAIILVGGIHSTRAQSSVTPDINRAVRVSWPTADGHQYQLFTSPDLRNWDSVGPVVIGNGHHREVYLPASASAEFYRVDQIAGYATNWFPGLQELFTAGTRLRAYGSTLEFADLRLTASEIGLDDLVNAWFEFTPDTQAYRLARYTLVRGVGVYQYPYFVNSANRSFTLKNDNGTLASETTYNLNVYPSGATFSGNLSTAQAVVFEFDDISGPLYFRGLGPDGSTNEVSLPATAAAVFSKPQAIVIPGLYSWTFMPANGTAVSFKFRFHNVNRGPLVTVAHGSEILHTFTAHWEYTKYRMHLKAGQLCSLTKPASSEVQLLLLNGKSEAVAKVVGFQLTYRAPEEGDYFLFIDHVRGAASISAPVDYWGFVSITN